MLSIDTIAHMSDKELQDLIDDLRAEQQERKEAKEKELINDFKTAFQKMVDNGILVHFATWDNDYVINDVDAFVFS